MLTHLLFSISALFFMIIFIITFFSYKKDTNSIRFKVYFYLILFALLLSIIEITEGVVYVYNVDIVFSLMWKLHSIIIVLFIGTLFYYFLISIVDLQVGNVSDLIWDNKNIFSVRNIFSIIFIILIFVSIILNETYPMRLTMFYFYTKESINHILILYLVYILYNFCVVYLKIQKNNFEINDYIVLIGTFILFMLGLVFEYFYSEISVYSALFTLVVILLYYFKENEYLLLIGDLQKNQASMYNNSYAKSKYLENLVSDLYGPINTFYLLNRKFENCMQLSDEELNNNITNINYVCKNLVDITNNQTIYGDIKYRIDELVINVSKLVETFLDEKNVKIVYEIDQNIPYLLVGDYINIYRVLSNLLVNAVESTDVGKIILSVVGERQKDNIIIRIKVSDTGCGIKEEDFNKVFINGFQNKKSNLYLVKKCVEALNGNIRFESTYGSGTIFYVAFSQKIYNESPISQLPLPVNNIDSYVCNNKKVLVLDDEEYSSKKITSILSKHNLDVKTVKSGKLAINMIKQGEEFDLVLINDNVKDVDFMRVAIILKYMKDLIKIPPLIALSSNMYNNDNYGYDEFIFKPLNIKQIDEIIKKRCL